MSTKKELRDQVLAEMNARRIDHKTYINSEWLLSEYETTLRKEKEEAYTKGYNAGLADGTGKPLLAIEQIREEAVAEAVKVTENTSDGYHTFKELYEFRKIYNAVLFNEWAKQGKYNVHKSMKHSDGELCFGGGWFIVVATLPTGDISNHYEMKDWGLFQCEEREIAKEWDGHTAKNVVERLQALAPQNTKTDDEQCSLCRYGCMYTSPGNKCYCKCHTN